MRAHRDADGGVRFSITDHGPGIPLQYQSRMFEKFFRVPGTDSRGAGLGLAIAREIVVAHDGHVGVNEPAREGERILFHSAGCRGANARCQIGAKEKMKKRVLIVEDERNVRMTYRSALETEGFDVTEAESGAAAVEKFAQSKFDVAVLDLRMPEMDGLELLEVMRDKNIKTPAVIITAYGDVPNAVKAMKLGAIDFLAKPVTPDQLRTHSERGDRATCACAGDRIENRVRRNIRLSRTCICSLPSAP